MPERRGKPSYRGTYRAQRGPMTWGRLALAWATGVITVLVVWGLLANGKPVDWAAAVAAALVSPTAAIFCLAWMMRQLADRLGAP